MQVLCIKTATPDKRFIISMIPQKGQLYNSYRVEPQGLIWEGVDLWHRLEELKPEEAAHVSLFIDLPIEEEQSFKKEETVEIPQKLQPFYAQL